MTDIDKLKEDVAYVRAATDRSESVPFSSIYVLWAVIILLGYPISDFVEDKSWIRWYWLVATPVGFLLSMWLGSRASARIGQVDKERGMRWVKHWLAFVVAGVLGGLLVAGGKLTGSGIGAFSVLLLALSYFYAGLHLDRRLVPVGIVIGICFPVILYLPGYGSTASGVVISGALLVVAFLGKGKSDASI
ncbi:MAG: hypothetical protein OXI19_07480 [Gemmatimonadota bacterium]|nr:hypothetical protein [Gemmatimonadota bacterium]MXW04418.1 hypothetical protein [Gemmatimonadota bacterium]MYB60410.1 hypothetical protein [Gemmatimonadota bacterium]